MMPSVLLHYPRVIFRLSRISISTKGRVNMINRSLSSDIHYKENEKSYDYENAIIQLQSLVSNAEVLAQKRANKELRQKNHIADVKKYLLRLGINEDDVDGMKMIHVSGTKGKGSTCAFCERILYNKGYKTGLFSSPHLVEVRERVRINGRPVSKELYAHNFWKVYLKLKATQDGKDEKFPAYFAFNMILSIYIFLAEGVDVGILEVGIGGQYDSTNFLRKPVVCGMTSLGLDHTLVLGKTLEEIAWNKAGIFKPGCPAIVVKHAHNAMKVVLDRAKERQSPLYVAEPIDPDLLKKENINLGISGCKQVENAGLAVQLTRMWEERHGKGCLEPVACNVSDVTDVNEIPVLTTTYLDGPVATGLSSCSWPGRAHTIKRTGVTYYLDGAHTNESIQVCSQWFKEAADEELKSVNGKVVRVLIFNLTGDRKPRPLLDCLKDCSFDAAGFCTNTVSTDDAFNKKDQDNPKYSSSMMLDITEANRQCWEEVVSSCKETDYSAEQELYSKDNGRKSSSENVSTNPTELATSLSVNSRDTAAKNTSMEMLSRGFTSAPSNSNPLNEDKEYKNINNTNNDNSNNNNVIKYNGTGVMVKPSLSHSFPCVLQALTWATQERDKRVYIKDPRSHLPPVPESLAGAAHIQVLVTGSLLLVGAVLGVVTPDMNDT